MFDAVTFTPFRYTRPYSFYALCKWELQMFQLISCGQFWSSSFHVYLVYGLICVTLIRAYHTMFVMASPRLKHVYRFEHLASWVNKIIRKSISWVLITDYGFMLSFCDLILWSLPFDRDFLFYLWCWGSRTPLVVLVLMAHLVRCQESRSLAFLKAILV